MQDVLLVEKPDGAEALLHPLRADVLKRLAEPRSCPEVARALGETTQKIYYHVKILEKAGLIDKVEERRVRGIMEGLYRAKASSYWLSPELVGRVGGGERARDRMSLGFLLTLAEDIQQDVARLAADADTGGHRVSSLGLSASIALSSIEQKKAFLAEVQDVFQALAGKYGHHGGSEADSGFRVSLVCYPKVPGQHKEREES